jgi:hypothetical protein
MPECLVVGTRRLALPWMAFMISVNCLAVLLSSCTNAPLYRNVETRVPPIPTGYTRIYLYTLNPHIDPGFEFSINGEVVAHLEGFQVLFVDKPAGSIKVTLNSAGVWPGSPPSDLVLDLSPGQTKYIEGAVSLGYRLLHVHMLLTDPHQATQDLRTCRYVGTDSSILSKG